MSATLSGSEPLTIRPGRRADIAPLDALFAASYPVLLKPDYPPSVLVTALPIIARAQPKLVTCGTYYVAEEAGHLRGGGGWTRARPATGTTQPGLAHIRHVAVDHRAARRGVGRALLSHIFAEARAAGITRMHCASTRTAVPFYQAMGFAVLGDVVIPLRPGIDFPAVEMMRSL